MLKKLQTNQNRTHQVKCGIYCPTWCRQFCGGNKIEYAMENSMISA